MQLPTFDKANRSQQNLPQGKRTLRRLRLVNNTDDVGPDKFLTEILVSEASQCSLIDFTMHWRDGSKKEATSELRKDIVLGRDIISDAYPRSFNWPKRMLNMGSLSRMPPNLIYWGLSAFLNLSLVVSSKHLAMRVISHEKLDCPSKPSEHHLTDSDNNRN